jgi:hypothetical protein
MFTNMVMEGRGKETVGAHLALLIFLTFFRDIAPTIAVETNFSLELA